MSNIEKEPGPEGDSPPISVENTEKKPREYKDFGHEKQQATSSYLFQLLFHVSDTPQQRHSWIWIQYGRLPISHIVLILFFQIELKAEDLYDKEKVDLETIVIDDVFKLLECDEGGLTEEEAVRRLEIFGPNKLEVDEQSAILQVSSFPSSSAFAQVHPPLSHPVS